MHIILLRRGNQMGRMFVYMNWLKDIFVQDSNRTGGGSVAFIDGQNVYLGLKESGWHFSIPRFRVYLKDKYKVRKAYYYLGEYKKEEQALYANLKRSGFIVRFKTAEKAGRMSEKKGNVDNDIIFDVMRMVADNEDFGKIIIVSSDGDYFRMIKYLIYRGKFGKILFPSKKKTSTLYKNLSDKYCLYMENIRGYIEYKKRNSP